MDARYPVAPRGRRRRPAPRAAAPEAVPAAGVERLGPNLAAGAGLAAAAGAVAAWGTGGAWAAGGIAALLAVTPATLLLTRGRRGLAVRAARRGAYRAEGTVTQVSPDRSGAPGRVRAAVQVYSAGSPRTFTAVQRGLDLRPGDRVEVTFVELRSTVCYVHRRIEANGAALLAADRIMSASPSELLDYLHRIEEVTNATSEQWRAIRGRVDELQRATDARQQARDSAGTGRVRYLQRYGLPGRARVRASHPAGGQAPSYVLTLEVTPDGMGARFDAELRLNLPPAHARRLTQPGARFDVRYDPRDRTQVVLAEHEIFGSPHRR